MKASEIMMRNGLSFFFFFPEGVYNQSQSGKKMCFLVIVLNLTFGRIHIGLVTEIG